jgi:hypothetical protein
VALRAAAEKLEHHSRSQGLRDVVALLDAVKHEFSRAQAELEKLVRR